MAQSELSRFLSVRCVFRTDSFTGVKFPIQLSGVKYGPLEIKSYIKHVNSRTFHSVAFHFA